MKWNPSRLNIKQTCNHARRLLCMTSWIVNMRPRTASCSSIISLVLFLIPSSRILVVFPLKCWRSSKTISSLAWRDHFTLITCVTLHNQCHSRTVLILEYSTKHAKDKDKWPILCCQHWNLKYMIWWINIAFWSDISRLHPQHEGLTGLKCT